MVTYTANKHLSKPANGEFVDTWDTPVNLDWDEIDTAFGGLVTINVVAASGTIDLSITQYQPRFIVFSGLLTASVTYRFPANVGGQWYVFNTTTGAFTVTMSSVGAGTTAVITQGTQGDIICDATNVRFGSAAAGANADITSLSGLTTPLSVAQGGTGAATLTGIPKGAGTAAFSVATAGTDYAKPNTASTWTATQTIAGASTVAAMLVTNAKEVATVSATAATGTITIYPSSQSVLVFTTNAAANWVVNLAFSVGTSMNTAMATGEILTLVFWVKQGGTAYYNTSVQVDGTTSGVTTYWQGAAPTAGTISSYNIYSYAILKTGNAAFTVAASVVAFA